MGHWGTVGLLVRLKDSFSRIGVACLQLRMPGILLGWRECNNCRRKKILSPVLFSYPFSGLDVYDKHLWLIVDQYSQSSIDQNSIDILIDPRSTKQ